MAPAAIPALLPEFFWRAAERWPDAVAVDVPPAPLRPVRRTCTYRQLAEAADRVTAALAGLVAEDAIVGLCFDRDGHGLYAAMLGTLAAGGAYLGLDPHHPQSHLGYQLDDARVAAVITDAAHAAFVAGIRPDVPRLVLEDLPAVRRPPAPPSWLRPNSLAYVVYTSGTTGRPKAVLIEHRSVCALVAGDQVEFGLAPGDRVAQGSSAAYDSSVEEVWLALAAGGTVVPMDQTTVRLGPDLVAWLRDERIAVLCPPPTLLQATGCLDPAAQLPGLRLIYAGGEALPQGLADRWSPGRRFVNGYGPTECTVTVVRGEVRPGEPVAIGRPVPGATAYVLDEHLEPVRQGTVGELCLGGSCLARGYLGQPELTRERFVEHPRFGRLYRTGDLVRAAEDGVLFFEGRRDAQVKLHGHRVELAEIDRRLAELPGVREGAAQVDDGRLLGWLVPNDPTQRPAAADLLAELRRQVPNHMVPARLGWLDRLPTTVGGKLDRRSLPGWSALAPNLPAAEAGAGASLAEVLAAQLGSVLGLPAVGVDDDFFDLGGDSVRAAGLVSRLRDDPTTAAVTVRDVYECRSPRRLAGRLTATAALPLHRPAVRRGTRATVAVGLLQALWLGGEFAVGALAGWCLLEAGDLSGVVEAGPLLVLLLPAAWGVVRLLWLPLALAVVVFAKRLLVGVYRSGRHEVYGWWYLRHWCLVRLARWLPWDLVQGTALQAQVLRALGARIGRGVLFARGVELRHGGWDLLEVGDGAVLGRDAALGVVEWFDGGVVLAPVTVGERAWLGVRAGLRGGGGLGRGAGLAPLACVLGGEQVPAGEVWGGVPAARVGAVAAAGGGMVRGNLGWTVRMLLWRSMAGSVMVAPLVVAAWSLGLPWDAAPGWVVLALLWVPIQLLVQALALRWGPKVPAGTWPTFGWLHALYLERTRHLEAAGVWLSGTMFWPLWLRLAGARIGRRVEVSTIDEVLPEHLVLGADSFLADGIYLGAPVVRPGWFTVGPVELGARTFLGNHVVVPAGIRLPDDLLLGVCTVADQAIMVAGTAWCGLPPMALPRREVVLADRRLTHDPAVWQIANRAGWELARGLLPLAPVLVAIQGWPLLAVAAGTGLPAAATWAGGLLLGAALGPLAILIAKWLLLGKVRRGQHPLWSCWCSRWDFLYVAWGFLCRPVLEPWSGTPWLPWYLRAMGMRIGRGVVLGPGFAQVVDPDMLHLEDGCTVDTMFQAHSFEDRVLKTAPVQVRAGATVGHASVVLYGADIGAGSEVAPHSVVWKEERLPAATAFAGAPVRPVMVAPPPGC